MIEVDGARLNVIDIGPRDAAGPPVVMIHGASSNLEVMRRPLGDMLAKDHRVILIDRPGHGWSTRTRNHRPGLTRAVRWAGMGDEAEIKRVRAKLKALSGRRSGSRRP